MDRKSRYFGDLVRRLSRTPGNVRRRTRTGTVQLQPSASPPEYGGSLARQARFDAGSNSAYRSDRSYAYCQAGNEQCKPANPAAHFAAGDSVGERSRRHAASFMSSDFGRFRRAA